MDDINTLDLEKSMEEDLKQRIEKISESIKSKEAKLNDSKKKPGIIDKMFYKRDIRDYQKEIQVLTNLSQSISSLYHESTNSYSIPEDLKNELSKLGTILSNDENQKLKDTVKGSLKSVNKEKEKKIKQEASKAQAEVEKIKPAQRSFQHWTWTQNIKNIYVGARNYNNALEIIKKSKLNELNPENFLINNNTEGPKLTAASEEFLTSLENQIKNGNLEKNKKAQSIIENFDQIKESFAARDRLNEAIPVLSDTIRDLSSVTEVDFSSVKSFLENVKNKYQKELDKTEKFLSKFDFSSIKEQVEKKDKEDEQEKLKESQITQYENLAYELEKVKTENPESNRVQEIEEEMRKLSMSMSSSFESLELEDKLLTANRNGRERYHQEQQMKKASADARKAAIDHENQVEANFMWDMRKFAEEELKATGAFEEQLEFRNGDIHTQPLDKEALIQKKIEELKKLADRIQDQESLEALKEEGRNNAYHFVNSYKKMQAREETKSKADNIMKDYLKYRASVQDKDKCLSFSNYAKEVHNINNIEYSMVNADLIALLAENPVKEFEDPKMEEGGISRGGK